MRELMLVDSLDSHVRMKGKESTRNENRGEGWIVDALWAKRRTGAQGQGSRR